MAQLHNAFRPGQVAQRMRTEVVQPGVVGQVVDNHRLGRSRQQGLTAVTEVAKPSGAVDRRADVVAFVAQLDLAGVDADPQPDRRKWSALQRQRARDRIAGAGEGDDEAVALPLLDRADAAVGGDQVRQRGIQPSNRGSHLCGLGLPQPRRTLDVGEQQRHRSCR